MSNRKKVVQPDGTVRKTYIPREQRRAARDLRRAINGAPPERQVSGGDALAMEGKSSLGVVEPYDPETGEALGPPRVAGDVKGDHQFLIEGTRHVYEALGGHAGFVRWARGHETKFRELAMKLLPAQVALQEKGIGISVTVVHALAPPNYDPSNLYEGEARKLTPAEQDAQDPVPQPDVHKRS